MRMGGLSTLPPRTSILETAFLDGRTTYISDTIYASSRLPGSGQDSRTRSCFIGTPRRQFKRHRECPHRLHCNSQSGNHCHRLRGCIPCECVFDRRIFYLRFSHGYSLQRHFRQRERGAKRWRQRHRHPSGLTWVALDNVTINTIDIPLVATVRAPQEVVYRTDANWSSQTTTTIDGVVIRDGAIVSLDQNATIPSLTLGQDSTPGFLNINQPFDLFISDHLSLTAESRVTLSDGNLEYDQTDFHLDGEIHVAGGNLSLRGSDVTGSGKLKITAGELNFLAARRIDLAEIEISGGTLDFIDGGSAAQTFLGANGVSSLTVIGSSPVVTVGRLNLQPTTSVSPIINFRHG